jgi:hypothetical protein
MSVRTYIPICAMRTRNVWKCLRSAYPSFDMSSLYSVFKVEMLPTGISLASIGGPDRKCIFSTLFSSWLPSSGISSRAVMLRISRAELQALGEKVRNKSHFCQRLPRHRQYTMQWQYLAAMLETSLLRPAVLSFFLNQKTLCLGRTDVPMN